MKRKISLILILLMLVTSLAGCAGDETADPNDETEPEASATPDLTSDSDGTTETKDGYVLLSGGTFTMGSPASELERETDEVQHEVTVSDFFIATSEVTQSRYTAVMGNNPSSSQGDLLPVTDVTWYDALQFCNRLSESEGLTPVYTIDGHDVSWDRTADGYRLPTEAEWEYAARAGTTTPFSFGDYVNDNDANCYNSYGYNNDASGNWINGYVQHTVDINSYPENGWGLYDMHGNAAEWVWDWYGPYNTETSTDPVGSEAGNYKVVRGGGWNDFPKNIRSAYRSVFPADVGLYSIGIRPVRSAVFSDEIITSSSLADRIPDVTEGRVLIAYFSATGNTKGLAEIIDGYTDADLFRIERAVPYRNLYSEALEEQRAYAIPDLANDLEDAGLDIDDYDTILLGYCNWWASIPAPIRSFLLEYDMSGKRIIPFSSQGGGVFGQTITAVAKLAPDSNIRQGLPVRYSSYDRDAVKEWLESNNITVQ